MSFLKAVVSELFNGWNFVGYLCMLVLIFGETSNPNTGPALLIVTVLSFIGQDIIDAIKEKKDD